MEKEITFSIREYRSVLLSLWRTLSGNAQGEYDWELCDAFADMCDGIFRETVLRPHGIAGVNKAKQYDPFPAEISRLICVPLPQERTFLISKHEEGRLHWEIAVLPPERWTFFFVDLYDFELYRPDRNFAYILTRAVPAGSTGRRSGVYALLPADTTRVMFRRDG